MSIPIGYPIAMDLVEFKRRTTRLAQTLIESRSVSGLPNYLVDLRETVDVQISADKVAVAMSVDELSVGILFATVTNFRDKFLPDTRSVLVVEPWISALRFHHARADTDRSVDLYAGGKVSLSVDPGSSLTLPKVTVTCPLANFGDHFEAFVTETLQSLFPAPPVKRPADSGLRDTNTGGRESRTAESEKADTWERRHRAAFESLGCRAIPAGRLSMEDLVGLDDIRDRLNEALIQPLQRRDLFAAIAKRVLPDSSWLLPRGVLLCGPPGCGKTRSMEVIGSAAGLPVVVIPVGGLLTKWFGESERQLIRLFERAREAAPVILLIDELDALGRRRADSQETTSRLVSILLSELDGLQGRSSVVVVGAVNDESLLDNALLDRFSLRVRYETPKTEALAKVFAYYARHLTEADAGKIAAHMRGWNFRRVAQFAEEALRRYVATLDLSQIEAHEPPLPPVAAYLDLLRHHHDQVLLGE